MKGKVEQAWVNHLKRLRAAVRTEYSILAGNELNRRVHEDQKKFFKGVQLGVVPKVARLTTITPDLDE